MDLLTLLTLAVGLAMDAFAVSICKGLAMREKVLKKGIIVGLWFGGFQALMPTIGFFLGTQFKDQITSIDHWIAFVLLGLIGINMVKEALSNDEEQADDSIASERNVHACCCDKYRCISSWDHICLFKCAYCIRSVDDWSLYFLDFICRSKDRKYFWNKI